VFGWDIPLMIVEVDGSSNPLLLSSAANFFGNKLLHKRMADNIYLNILITKLEEGYDGDCIWQDIWHRPREFEIRINSTLEEKDQIKIIAHEMVHLKQFARGELRFLLKDNQKMARFNGKFFKVKNNYWESPWEIEAFGREIGLMHYWNQMNNEQSN
jgi:hypothetical protein